MSSNFFTNEETNTLKNRINSILKKDKNIEYLDFLIGYFRITGFDKISDSLSNIIKTRILVGISADKSRFWTQKSFTFDEILGMGFFE